MPFAISASHQGDRGFATGVALRVGFDLVADERCDLAEVEVCEQHRHDDLGSSESAHPASSRGFDVFGSAGFDLGVEGFNGVAGVGVELRPLRGSLFNCLMVSAGLRGVEGDGVLLADLVCEVRYVGRVDTGALLVSDGFQ